MTDIPQYPKPPEKKEDPVARSLAKPDACAKPCSLKSSSVRVRPTNPKDWNRVKIRKKRRKWDRRDVRFY